MDRSKDGPHFLSRSSPTVPRDAVRVSIVIPIYRGEKTIGRLVHTLASDLAGRYDLEIVLVNDGSPDNAAAVCRQLATEVPGVKFVNLSRNFGEHNAVMAGLNQATGDYAVIMDDDFQNPPEEVGKLVEEIRRGYDVVFSYYERKQHHWFRNLGSRLNNYVASVLLKKPRDVYLSSFKAISRFAINEIIKYEGPYPYIDGLILRVTRSYSRVAVRHDPRSEGKSGYTLAKLVGLWLNMFTNFSVVPLRMATVAGFVFSLLGLASAVAFAVEKLRNPDLPVGWASLICSLFVIGGVQLFALGMIGEYLGRLFLKIGGQPQFVIREIVEGTEARQSPPVAESAPRFQPPSQRPSG
jgi:undecaprenyl-phosphate 4-deoxy-4-formamido-L-arabinose transferase